MVSSKLAGWLPVCCLHVCAVHEANNFVIALETDSEAFPLGAKYGHDND